jgi:hypothetical protein
MREAQHYLGMTIVWDRQVRSLKLVQEKFCLETAQRFSIEPSDKVRSPLPSGFETFYLHELPSAVDTGKGLPSEGSPDPFDPELDESGSKVFQQMIGCLNYISQVTRPDVAYAVSQLARVMFRPRQRHMKAACHCISYLLSTRTLGITYTAEAGSVLQAYSDSDFQNCKSSKSIPGLIFMLAGGPVHWLSKRQDRVTNSTCEAEAQALITCPQHVCYMRDLLEEIGLTQTGPTPVLCDNQATVDLSIDPVSHHRTKQLRKAMHYVRELRELGIISPTLVGTQFQLADFLTKHCRVQDFVRNIEQVGLRQ